MATTQSVNIVSINAQGLNTVTEGFPGPVPSTLSPSPIWALPSGHIQGVYGYSNPLFPNANAIVNVSYNYKQQVTSVNVYVTQTVATIIAAS
jgi:hypothetical protein